MADLMVMLDENLVVSMADETVWNLVGWLVLLGKNLVVLLVVGTVLNWVGLMARLDFDSVDLMVLLGENLVGLMAGMAA